MNEVRLIWALVVHNINCRVGARVDDSTAVLMCCGMFCRCMYVMLC